MNTFIGQFEPVLADIGAIVSPSGEELDTEGLVNLLRQVRDRPLADVVDHLREELDRFTEGAPPHDDRTVMLVRRSGGHHA